MGTVEIVVGVALVSLFYGLAVSLVLPYFPGVTNSQLAFFTDGQGISKIATMNAGLQQGMQFQSTIPFLDFGTLIFYSSITAFNVFMNVLTAVPQMLNILVHGLLLLLHIPNEIALTVQLGLGIFTTLVMFAMFVFIISSRSPTYGGIR